MRKNIERGGGDEEGREERGKKNYLKLIILY